MSGFAWVLFCLQGTEHDDHRFKGFMQVYQLQTENDEEETWRDLVSFSPP